MRNNERLNFQQKFGLGVFVLIAGATFVFGLLRLQKDIVLPLYRPESDFTIKTTEQIEQERQMELQAADTDKDGLNDYDELYVFRTSPFLEDSDSDGVLDGLEVKNQTDPNCPLGKTCGQLAPREGAGSTAPSRTTVPYPINAPTMGTIEPGLEGEGTTVPGAPSEEEIMIIVAETFGDPTTLTTEEIAQQLQTMPSDELRVFLTRIGIPADILSKTDDATIRALLQETLNEMSAEGLGAGGQ